MLLWRNQLTILATSALLFIYMVKAHADESQRIAICGPHALYREFTKEPKVIPNSEAELHIGSGDFQYNRNPANVQATRVVYVFKFKGQEFRTTSAGGQAKAIRLFRFHCSAAGRGNHKVVILGRGELK